MGGYSLLNTGRRKRTLLRIGGCNRDMRLSESRAEILFGLYYQLGGERSLAKLWKYLCGIGVRISEGTLENYSKRFNWQARVVELDAKLQEQRDSALVNKVQAMNDRQANLGRGMQTIAAGKIKYILDDKEASKKIALADAAGLAATGVKIERLALGAPTERREAVILVWNVMLAQVVNIFKEVNTIKDSHERIELFAQKVDLLAESNLKDV